MMLRALGRLLAAHPAVAVGVALLLRGELGAAPWEVFHAGLAHATGGTVGLAASATAVMAVAIALVAGVRPGLGTLVNVVLLGACIDAALAVVPVAPSVGLAACYLLGGIVLLGLGTGLYVSARLGAGPRDSLMIALTRRRGWSISRARIVVELIALAAGLVLGGRAGIGTLVYAAGIGPATQWGIDLFVKEST
jgi:uncharacterized membrane protein YczE